MSGGERRYDPTFAALEQRLGRAQRCRVATTMGVECGLEEGDVHEVAADAVADRVVRASPRRIARAVSRW